MSYNNTKIFIVQFLDVFIISKCKKYIKCLNCIAYFLISSLVFHWLKIPYKTVSISKFGTPKQINEFPLFATAYQHFSPLIAKMLRISCLLATFTCDLRYCGFWLAICRTFDVSITSPVSVSNPSPLCQLSSYEVS